MAKGKMKALVWVAPCKIGLQEKDVPIPQEDEVLIRVRAAGICGSEVEGFLGKSDKRVPPLIMGHEFTGEVVEIVARTGGRGGPIAVRVGGSTFALRAHEAALLHVREAA